MAQSVHEVKEGFKSLSFGLDADLLHFVDKKSMAMLRCCSRALSILNICRAEGLPIGHTLTELVDPLLPLISIVRPQPSVSSPPARPYQPQREHWREMYQLYHSRLQRPASRVRFKILLLSFSMRSP